MAVLGAIVPSSYARLETARRLLKPEWLTVQAQRDLLVLLGNYADLTGEMMTRDVLGQVLGQARVAPGQFQLIVETYDLARGLEVTQGQFVWAVQLLRDQASDRAFGSALAEAYEIADRGISDGSGGKIIGATAARERLSTRLAEIGADQAGEESPEGQVEFTELVTSYNETMRRRQAGEDPGVALGISTIDGYLGGGLRRGELALLVAFSTAGKTSLCVSIAWHAVMAGRNVVFFTAETLRGDLSQRLVARHSRHPRYAAELPAGLDSLKMRAGTLSPLEYQWFGEVARDFTSGHRCYIAQIAYGETLASLSGRLSRISRMFPPDLVIVDYLQLVRADRRRDASNEEKAQLLRDTKQLAGTFGGGMGIPVISPWQVNRSGRQQALGRDRGFYTGLDLAETAEAFNTPDVVLGLMNPETIENFRAVQLRADLIKNRNGPRGAPVRLTADFATCEFREGDSTQGAGMLAGDDISSLVV